MRGTEFAEMTAFVAIAEAKSFAKAAVQLGVSRPTLSQSLRALEERLGVRLLHRTTRSVALTDAGERLLVRARPALGELRSAAEEIGRLRDDPSGPLRIVAQPPPAIFLVAPILGPFLAQYPGISLDVSVQKVPPQDIVRENFDAGIRVGEQIQRDMIATRVSGEAAFVAVASPEYLARHPAPRTPRDLRDHDCIRARLPNGAVFGWEFQKKGEVVQLAVQGRLVVDDIPLMIRAAIGGVGIGYVLRDYVDEDIAEGRLVTLLDDWTPKLSGFFLYHSSRRQMTAPLRAFVAFLRAQADARARPHGRANGKGNAKAPSGASARAGHRLVR